MSHISPVLKVENSVTLNVLGNLANGERCGERYIRAHNILT